MQTTTLHRLGLAAALTLSAAAAQAATVFTATLTGDQQVPPVVTDASGSATLTLNDAMDALAYEITVMGIDVADFTGGHFHSAPAGANGPVIFGFQGPVGGPVDDVDGDLTLIGDMMGFTVSGVWDGAEGRNGMTLADDIATFLSGGVYINIHSTAFPSGEVRGQVAPIPLPAAAGLLAGGLGLMWGAGRRRA